MTIDSALYKVEMACDNETISSEEVICAPDKTLNVSLISLATNEAISSYNLTKEQLRCMDGDVMDIFFKFENQTSTTNATDTSNSTSNSTDETVVEEVEPVYEISWTTDSCMEPWKHTL